MKYSDLSINLGFTKNMQETNWLKLFPKWWSENDPLLETIGKEIAYLKAQAIFELLNTTIKPPVMIWQNSIVHKKYIDEWTIETLKIENEDENGNITYDPEIIAFPAPFYKTFGKIILKNYTKDDISNLKIGLTKSDYIIIEDIIQEDDEIIIEVGTGNVKINNQEANIITNGDAFTYFKTSGIYEITNSDPLHHEAINLHFYNEDDIEDVNIHVIIEYDNVVFINEQNIEVNGLELIPIDYIELYAYYDFPFNPVSNGWRKVYEKKYDKNTNVIYDMITTQFYTKKFYVHVYYKGLDYPYIVGFPAYKDAKKRSIYHINEHIDEWGKYLGLKRRLYKTNIPDEDYPFTFPEYYPFDIEQDYWYYKRLISEYAWNDLAINDVDLIDTNGDPVLRLHSIDPFTRDFVVYAESKYPKEQEDIDYNIFIPDWVDQSRVVEAEYKRVQYYDTQNLLYYDNNKAYVTLANKAGTNISSQKYLSKPLELFYDLTNIPANVDIKDIKIIAEAESTDNGLEKYSNSETGIIIRGISEDKIFTMKQSENYELEEKEIEYNLSDSIDEIKKLYDKVDTNVLQKATIQSFSSKQKSYIIIPFVLKENDTIIDDITEVYVRYEGFGVYQGTYHYDSKAKKRYIKVYMPQIFTEGTTYSSKLNDTIQMRIACKTNQHSSFVADNIELKIKIVDYEYDELVDTDVMYEDSTTEAIYNNIDVNYEVDENGNKVLDSNGKLVLLENKIKNVIVYGPIKNEKQQTLEYTDEWHTGDIRNALQKDGISFINVFQNDSETNVSTIFLKNVRLKIEYSPKKNNFNLETEIKKNDLINPSIGKLLVKITNTGSMELLTKIDIISATNIKLSKSYIDVDLNIGDSLIETIDIIPEYPIYDGQYDILTVCEDQTCHNTIALTSSGLIPTEVILDQHYGKYDLPINLKAKVNNLLQESIDDDISKIVFYIDDYKVAESIIKNNKGNVEIIPSSFNFIQPGIHILEARFTGNEKFASSRVKTSLLISKNNTNIDIVANDTVVYGKPYQINTNIYYYDENQVKTNINEGNVTFYIDDDEIGTVTVVNGIANLNINSIEYEADDYTITTIYNGTENYARNENTKLLTVIGGNTNVKVFDINAKPSDVVTLKAQVFNAKNVPLSLGYVVFKILDDTTTIYTSPHIPINKGVGTYDYTINDDVLGDDDNGTKTYTVSTTYIDNTNLYQSNTTTSTLNIKKGEVIITNANIYFGSQYEPLGFYVTVKDAETNENINNGKITITIPKLNIECPAQLLDNDGGARIIHNPINFTADEFDKLLKFFFQEGKLMPYRDQNNNIVKLYADESSTELINFENDNLYRIYNGNLEDLNLMDFYRGKEENNEDPNALYYKINSEQSQSDVSERVFVSEDGYLYARTNIDTIRRYLTGTFPITINYSSSYKYKTKNKYANIQLNQGSIDIDIHSQVVTYGDINKSIIAYITEYNLNDDLPTIPINEGKVWFLVDNNKVAESDIENGLATLLPRDLTNIPYGNHLLTVQYMSETKPITYTYTDLTIKPIVSSVIGTLNKQFKGEKSKLNVSVHIDGNYDVPITGTIDVYIDDVFITSSTLFGIEDITGNVYNDEYNYNHTNTSVVQFIIDMPEDLDVMQHTLRIEYSGDEHILPASYTKTLKEEPLPVNIETNPIYVGAGEKCSLSLEISSNDDALINEGEICIYKKLPNNEILQAKDYIENNKGTLSWVVSETPSEQPYTYVIKYENGIHYTNPLIPFTQLIYVINPLDDVYVTQNDDDSNLPTDAYPFKKLSEALQCVKNNGNIHILDTVNITNNLIIDKDINILGTNNSTIIKDIPNLMQENISTLKIYSEKDFDIPIYEITGLTFSHLNIVDFHIIDTDIYFVKNGTLIPIFLLGNGSFYSYQQISLSEIISNINITFNGQTTIDNIHFKSNDSDNTNDLIIQAQNKLTITKCIIDDTIYINNQNELIIHNSAIYGHIVGSTNYNLDNNWWGSNTPPQYNLNNHIILKISSKSDPPIIGDNINILVELIGNNGIKYDLPSLDYYFESEFGYFTIQYGKLIENTARTVYIDSAKEDSVYCTVDNETVHIDILGYDHKTEVILNPANEIPVGFQIPLRAKVQSLADTYENTQLINEGYVDFYINNKQVGHARVIDGEAETPLYFSTQQYPLTDATDIRTIEMKAIYKPEDYYYTSQAQKNITLINPNNVCFVSPNATFNGEGTFQNPFDSINNAFLSNKERIYLKPGTYRDMEIVVNNTTQDIRAYNGECIFENKDKTIFKGNGTLILTGLTFKNNTANYLIEDIGTVTIQQCIFYNNKTLIKHKNNTSISHSVIIDYNHILSRYNNNVKITKCWFGTNTPSDPDIALNDYIIMDFVSEKDPIYIGSVTHLTASLSHYKHNDEILLLEEPLPLRIAQFSSSYGSLTPLKDDTYDNKATTFLNTNADANYDKIILTTPTNTNYITKPLTLQCYVNDVYGQKITDGQVNFKFKYDDQDISLYGDIEDGIATVVYDTPLNIGEYQLRCSYDNNIITSSFEVTTPNIEIEEFYIDDSDHIYDLSFNLKITDSFNTEHINQKINIFIDDVFIKQEKIIDSILNTHIIYDFITVGNHTLKINTEGLDSEYDIFEIEKDFIATQKNTYIDFDYIGLTANEPTDLIIKVYDKDNRLVTNGSIDIKYDNEQVYVDRDSNYIRQETQYSNIQLQNGIGVIYGFYSEEGQHSIMVHYNGDESIYNDCIYNNSKFNVGLDEVIIASEELENQLSVDIGQTFTLHFPIIDKYKNKVQRGEVNLFIDQNIAINKKPLIVEDGYVSFEGKLPIETKAMMHDFTITYSDPSSKYISTTYTTKINVKKIKTQIIADTIYTAPNSDTTINYVIESKYGEVRSGHIEAYYDNVMLNWSDVSSITTEMTLSIPLLPATEIYDVVLKYVSDDRSSYENSETIVKMIIVKPTVDISVETTEYYPNVDFNYVINVTHNNKKINFGTIKLYIDNVETDTQQVLNGQANTWISLDTVKDYNFKIVYEDNDYYALSSEDFTFTINNISLKDISISDTHSIPNTQLETIVNINAPNDINVTDGLIDFYIDKDKINTFSVTEDTKYVKLDIPNINAGTHQMTFKYYDSAIFKNNIFTHDFIIDTQTIDMTIPETYMATLNDTIDFNVELDKNVISSLEFYLIAVEDDTNIMSRLIGIEQINNQNIINFQYTLPNDLEQINTNYKVQIKFVGNEQYEPITKEMNLIIDKRKPIFEEYIVSSTVEYQSQVNIFCKTDISNATLVYFYLDTEDNQIGYKQTDDVNDDGYINFKYNLNKNMYPDEEHKIIMVIKESTTLQKVSVNKTFTITKSTPTLSIAHMEAYVGQEITLPTNVIDNKGFDVTDGTLKYYINDTLIKSGQPNEEIIYKLDNTYTTEKEIIVKYQSAEDSYYNNFEDTLIITLNKNILNIDIDGDNVVTRGNVIEKNVILSSNTIDEIPDLTYKVYLEDTEVKTLPSLTIPKTLPDKKEYILKIVFDGNDVFYPRTKEFILINQNEQSIDVTDDLELAFNLVADHGIINIKEDLEDISVINNKNVTIKGNDHTLTNCNIENIGKLIVEDLIFTKSEDSALKNNGELIVQKCTFMDNSAAYGAAIYIDSKNINTEVANCTFNKNKASVYGGAIFSNKGNDVTITLSTFSNNNEGKMKGSSIASTGNIYISQNMFYNNIGACEIYIINGQLEAENNYFDGNITALENKGTAICNLNYWGYNDINDITINGDGTTTIDSWLISNYTIDYTQPVGEPLQKIITTMINQYKNKTQPGENKYKDVIGNVPIMINDDEEKLNKPITRTDENITIIIGQQVIEVRGN